MVTPEQTRLFANWLRENVGEGAAAQVFDLLAQVEALQADAERYRWLRGYNVDSFLACGTLESLDAAIDAARKDQP